MSYFVFLCVCVCACVCTLYSIPSNFPLFYDSLVALLRDIGDLKGGRERLLELLGLLGVLEHQGVQVLLATDLELDVLGLLVLLDARGGGVLPTADLDELLDISDFARHYGGVVLFDRKNYD